MDSDSFQFQFSPETVLGYSYVSDEGMELRSLYNREFCMVSLQFHFTPINFRRSPSVRSYLQVTTQLNYDVGLSYV